ncbi:unnamed protein product [Amoebophrya sp. A120]|nr:unnamed protein product [Amoebophrya sp. A120]|eukprot:GSA120T00013072001.1
MTRSRFLPPRCDIWSLNHFALPYIGKRIGKVFSKQNPHTVKMAKMMKMMKAADAAPVMKKMSMKMSMKMKMMSMKKK